MSQNQFAAAKFFDTTIELMRELLIYGGKEKRKAKGIFSYAISDYICVECQKRGTVHGHGLV